MSDFITWSGWLCTLISTAIAIWQSFEKEKYKKLSQKTNIGDRKETYKAKDGGIAIKKNHGSINMK